MTRPGTARWGWRWGIRPLKTTSDTKGDNHGDHPEQRSANKKSEFGHACHALHFDMIMTVFRAILQVLVLRLAIWRDKLAWLS